MIEQQWISTQETLKMLHIKTVNTLQAWSLKYNLTSTKIGGKRYWLAEQIKGLFPSKP